MRWSTQRDRRTARRHSGAKSSRILGLILLLYGAGLIGRPLQAQEAPVSISAAGPTLRELAAGLDEPVFGPRIELDGAIVLGRASLHPVGGSSVRLLLAAGRPCGLYLSGPLTFQYEVADRFSVPIAQRNFENHSKYKPTLQGGKFIVRETMEDAIIWSWEIGAQHAPEGFEAAGGSVPNWIRDALTRPYNYSTAALELLAARGHGTPGVGMAMVRGKKDSLLVSVDPADARLDQLGKLEPIDSGFLYGDDKGRWRVVPLAGQPIDREWWENAAAPLVAVHQKIDVVNPEKSYLKIDTVSRLQATADGVSVWRLTLADRTLDFNRFIHPVEIVSVEAGGRPAAFHRAGRELLVELPRPLAAGEEIEVAITHHGNMAHRPGGDRYWSLRTSAWYPKRMMEGQLAEIELSLTVPKELVPFATGTEVSRKTGETHTTLETRVEHPTHFVSIAAGKFHTFSEERDGLRVNVASYATKKKTGAQRLPNNTFAVSEYFQHIFGVSYPFDELDVVEINSWGFGQAPGGMLFITQEAFDPLGTIQNRFWSEGVNSRFVHELAHGWWGHAIKMMSMEEQWLSESFAEYFATFALVAMRGGGKAGEREMTRALREWKARADRVEVGSVYLANQLAGDSLIDSEDRVYLLYGKGPLVLHGLRQELQRMYGEQGDLYFVSMANNLFQNFNQQWGETRHLVSILNQLTQKDWQPWFEKYVYGTETPPVDF